MLLNYMLPILVGTGKTRSGGWVRDEVKRGAGEGGHRLYLWKGPPPPHLPLFFCPLYRLITYVKQQMKSIPFHIIGLIVRISLHSFEK